MTFRQLKDSADCFAACLRQKLSASDSNLQRQPTVLIIMSLENIQCVPLLFGILKCGAAYCWFAPPSTDVDEHIIGQWQDHLEGALRRLKPALTIIEDDDVIQRHLTTPIINAQYNIVPFTLLQQLAFGMLDTDRIALEEDLMHADMAFSSDHSPAAILYSANSTITLSHLAISNQLATLWRCLPFATGEISIWYSPLNSARHIFELLTPLLFGRPVVIAPGMNLQTDAEQFLTIVKQHRPRRLILTALQLHLLVECLEARENSVKNSAKSSNRALVADSGRSGTNSIAFLRLVCVVEQLGTPPLAAYALMDNDHPPNGESTYKRDFHCNAHLRRKFFRNFADCKLALLYTAQPLHDTLMSWAVFDDEDDVPNTAQLPLGIPALNSCLCIANSNGILVRHGTTGFLWAVNTSLPQSSASVHLATKTLHVKARSGNNDDDLGRNRQNHLYEQVPPHFTCTNCLATQSATDQRLMLIDADSAQQVRPHSEGDSGWLLLPKTEYELREALVGDRYEPRALHALLLKSSVQCVLLVVVQIDRRLLEEAATSEAEKMSTNKKKSRSKTAKTEATSRADDGNDENKLKQLCERTISAALTNIIRTQFAAGTNRGRLRPEFSWSVCAVAEPFPMTTHATLDSVELLTMVKRQLVFSNQLGFSNERRNSNHLLSPNYYHLFSPDESNKIGAYGDDNVWVLEDSMQLAKKHEADSGHSAAKHSAKRKANESEQSVVRALIMTRQNEPFAIFVRDSKNEAMKLERTIFDYGIHYGNIVEFLRNSHSFGSARTLNDFIDTSERWNLAELAAKNSNESTNSDTKEKPSQSNYIVKAFAQLSFVEIDQALSALANAIASRGEYDMYVDTTAAHYRRLFDGWKRLPEWREQSFVLLESAEPNAKIVGVALGATWTIDNQNAKAKNIRSYNSNSESESTDEEQSEAKSKHSLRDAANTADHLLLSSLLKICYENEQKLLKDYENLEKSSLPIRAGRLLFRMPAILTRRYDAVEEEAHFIAVAVRLEQEAIKLAKSNKCDLLVAHCTNSFQQSMTEYQLGYDKGMVMESTLKQTLSLPASVNQFSAQINHLMDRLPDTSVLVSRGMALKRRLQMST